MISQQTLKGNLLLQDYTTAFTLNQGDKGVPFKVELLENGTPYILQSTDIVTIEWLKPNGNPFLQEGDIKYGTTYIEFTTPEAIAQCNGSGSFNIIISNGDLRKGTIRREYKVVPTSMKPGSISEDVITDAITELRELSLEIADIVQNNQTLINRNQVATQNQVNTINSNINTINSNITSINSSLEENANLIKLLEENKLFFYGAKGDGTTDDTQAIQSYLNSLTDTSTVETLYIPPNKTFLVNDLIINRKNLVIKGGGTIKGTVKIKFDDVTFANIYFRDITFLQDTSNTANCVEIENTFNVYFDRCVFKNGKAGVFFVDKGVKHSGYSKITNCNFHYNNYCVLLDNNITSYNDYQVADLLISNCHFYSTQIDNIHLVGIDGITIVECTAFFGSYALKEPNKTYNIYIKNCNFAIIEGNNLFESGAESIKLVTYKNTDVKGNNIAWSGQRLKTPAIHLCLTTQGDPSEFVNSNVEGNNINCPCYVGIKVDGYVTGLGVKGNQILFGGDNNYYYGDEEILLSERRSIVTTSSVLENCLITGNMYPNSIDDIKVSTPYIKGTRVVNNFSQYGLVNKGYTSYNVNSSSEAKTINYTDKTLLGYDNIILQGSNSITITNFGTDSMFDYKEITVISYASNVIFVHGSGIMLKDPSNTSMGANKMKKFEYYAGQWFEL